MEHSLAVGSKPSTHIRIYVVTYRRPHLLERALRSLVTQTHPYWVAEVLNDDPADARVDEVIRRIGDPRIVLSSPPMKRGGTGNFNHAFRTVSEPFASILEDDNWWEPGFLEAALACLQRHPEATVLCGNERVWREEIDGSWTEDRIVRPVSPAESLLDVEIAAKCGAAALCNSALLFRTEGAEAFQTPASIPIDVTEHYRERAIPNPIVLMNAPLVNYAETLQTHRGNGDSWDTHVLLLTGSTFALCPPERRAGLAADLWRRARSLTPSNAVSLIAVGLFIPEARVILRHVRLGEAARFALYAARRPRRIMKLARARRRHAVEWQWLLQGAFADYVRAQDASARRAATPSCGQPAKNSSLASPASIRRLQNHRLGSSYSPAIPQSSFRALLRRR